MSVFRNSGRLVRRDLLVHKIGAEISKVNLVPVQRVAYTFDAFHENAEVIRKVMYYMSHPKVRETNYKTVFKTNVVCDLSEPTIECKLSSGKSLLFKTGNLTLLEILQHFNKHVLPLVPPPQDLSTSIPKTKSQKKRK